MKRGYSKVILNEYILPARDCPQSASWADMHMMGGLAALERSERQWLDLVEGTGLQVVKFWFPEGSIDGVIELMLADDDGGKRGVETNGHAVVEDGKGQVKVNGHGLENGKGEAVPNGHGLEDGKAEVLANGHF